MRVIVAILIAGAGCTSTHRSTLPPYVRDVRVAPAGGLEVVQCEIIFTQIDRTSWNWFTFDTEEETETSLTQGACWRSVISTAVAQPAPVVQP